MPPRLRVATLAATLLVAILASSADAALTPNAACRGAVAKSARHAMTVVASARAKCLRARLKRDLPATVDCLADPSALGGTGTGDATTDAALAALLTWRDRRANVLARSCAAADLQASGAAGACSPPASSTTQIAQCAVMEAGKEAGDALSAVVNVPRPSSTPPEDARKCFDSVTRALSYNASSFNRLRADCFDTEEELGTDLHCLVTIAPPGFTGTTGNTDVDQRLTKRARRWQTLLRSFCGIPSLSTINFPAAMGDPTAPPFKVDDLIERMYDAILGAAARIDEASFPDEPYCGDGHVDAGEACDDGDRSSCDGCDRDCSLSACRNGALCAPETCDDGNAVSGDGCSPSCSQELPGCGNGVLEPGEQCDDGAANSDSQPDACRTDCRDAHCGDGVTDTGEGCDPPDGITCAADCTPLLCGNGTLDSGEQCDDGGESAGCDSDCTLASCGDGRRNATAGEACDTGGVNTATCDSDCTTPQCGDPVFNPAAGEACDDGNHTSGDGCDSNCTPTGCGNSIVTAGEECDDGNHTSGDGCSATCTCGIGSGEQPPCITPDPQCPNLGELTLLAGTGEDCSTNADCLAGTCSATLHRCVTATALDTGWTGIAHDSDINDHIVTYGKLLCPGPAPTCGDCFVAGIDPRNRICRCANDNRLVCDQPCVSDANDCAGNICNCYFGGPLPLSAGNTPACVVNRFASDVSGTANVDTGAGAVNAHLRSLVFLGETLVTPCPVCGGTCTGGTVGATCALDVHCDTSLLAGDGVCGNYDPTPNDGIRGGRCYLGRNDSASCDIDSPNTSFPAPGGGGHSLDCFPINGKNVSGAGLVIDLTQTTGSVSLPAALPCNFGNVDLCPCGECSLSTTTGCRTNADCAAQSPPAGQCKVDTQFKPIPNGCTDGVCNDMGGGEGACTPNSPNPGDNVDKYCDGITRSNGEGFIGCSTNVDCDAGTIGVAAGSCTLTKTRECFVYPITATGVANASKPLGVAAFCIGKTANTGINDVAGLPGPGRVINQGRSRLFCASNQAMQYQPGGGGCP